MSKKNKKPSIAKILEDRLDDEPQQEAERQPVRAEEEPAAPAVQATVPAEQRGGPTVVRWIAPLADGPEPDDGATKIRAPQGERPPMPRDILNRKD